MIPAVVALCGVLAAPTALAFEPIGVEGHTQDLVRAADGTIYVVWTSGTAKNATVNFGEFDEANGQVSGQEEIANGIDAWFGRPLLSVSPNGVHVQTVWNRDIPNSDHGRVELAVRGAGGGWEVSTVIEQGDPWHYTQPSVAVRNDGSSHVAYQQWPSQGTGEYAVYTWRAAGGAFSPPEQVSGNGGRDVAMAVDHNDGLHLRYSRGYRYAPAGSTLSEAQHMDAPKHDESTDGPFFGDMFVDGTDTVHLVFDDCVSCTADGTHSIGHTTIPVGGSSFSVPTRASGDPFAGEDPWPAVGVDGQGTVFVMWCPSTSTTSECKASSRVPGSSTWSEHTVDAQAGMSRANKPTVLVTEAAVYGFWRTDGGSIVMENLSALVPGPDAGPADAPHEVGVDAAQDAKNDGPIVSPDGGGTEGGTSANPDGSAGVGGNSASAGSDSDDGCGCSAPGAGGWSGAWWTIALACAGAAVELRRSGRRKRSA